VGESWKVAHNWGPKEIFGHEQTNEEAPQNQYNEAVTLRQTRSKNGVPLRRAITFTVVF
jgi:hypothetical protein